MSRLFYFDSFEKQEFTYEQLLRDIRLTTSFNKCCKTNDYYSIFKRVIVSLLLDREIVLLDGDFSDQEVERLMQDDIEHHDEPIEEDLFQALTLENFIAQIKVHSCNWKIRIFTSGTTGVPKSIAHSFDSLTRQVRISDRHSGDIWGFAYNPTHMAGLQVFLQALMNLNPMIRLFQISKSEVFDLVNRFGITNISATPTFYRLLLPCNELFNSVKRITSGGEKFDVNVKEQLQLIFPTAKMTNVYASTEAGTLFASSGDCFEIKPEIQHLFKIEQNELLIHRSLLGTSENMVGDGEWYHSGDLIEVIEKSPVLRFRFISRANEMINVAGYKVNPNEVEEVIRSFDGVKDAKVYAKSNALIGNVLCAQIVSSKLLDEPNIRKYLQVRLQEFKIPRVIQFVSSIDMTRTGKMKR